MLDGYNKRAGAFGVHKLSLVDMMLLNTDAELQQLMQEYNPSVVKERQEAQRYASTATGFLQTSSKKVSDFFKSKDDSQDPLDDMHWESRVARNGRCTGYVRVSSEDMFAGHTTWNDFSKMTRVFKFYDFPLPGASTVARKIAMSSYPGLISSGDEYYVMDSGLVTLGILKNVFSVFFKIKKPFLSKNREFFSSYF